MTIYFAKINLISDHIYKVYNDELKMRDILLNVLINFNSDLHWEEEYTYIGEDGAQHTNTISYSVYVKDKTDSIIRGRLDKESKLFYKEKNPLTNELESKSISNTDAIEFYFDVFSEMVGYNTSNRFGHKKFLKVFSEILNQASLKGQQNYLFEVNRYTNGINMDNLYKELKNIKNIQKLLFSFKPVNPDTDTLMSIQNNGLDKLEEFEEANLSSKSILLTSASKLGLNIDSKVITETIEEANSLHRDIPIERATRNGYVKIEAIGRDGITRSTEDRAPVKKSIKRMAEFEKACQEVINIKIGYSLNIED